MCVFVIRIFRNISQDYLNRIIRFVLLWWGWRSWRIFLIFFVFIYPLMLSFPLELSPRPILCRRSPFIRRLQIRSNNYFYNRKAIFFRFYFHSATKKCYSPWDHTWKYWQGNSLQDFVQKKKTKTDRLSLQRIEALDIPVRLRVWISHTIWTRHLLEPLHWQRIMKAIRHSIFELYISLQRLFGDICKLRNTHRAM